MVSVRLGMWNNGVGALQYVKTKQLILLLLNRSSRESREREIYNVYGVVFFGKKNLKVGLVFKIVRVYMIKSIVKIDVIYVIYLWLGQIISYYIVHSYTF